MCLGFLDSRPVSERGRGRRAMRWLWYLARSTVSVGIGLALLGLAIGGVLARLKTGSWPGPTMLELVERLIGEPVLTTPWGWGALHGVQQLLRWLLALVPAALLGLLGAGWAACKLFPRRGSPRTPRNETIADVKAEVRRLGGESVVVVSRQRPRLLEVLQEEFRGNPRVHVIMDRRWGPNRVRKQARENERRRGDRRQGLDWSTAGLTPAEVVVARRAHGEATTRARPETASDKETG